QGLARLEAEFAAKLPSAESVGFQRRRLAAAAIERQHQLSAQRLPKRVPADKRLQLADHIGMAPERQFDFEPLLDRRQAKLSESVALAVPMRGSKLGKGFAAPERERLSELRGRRLWIAASERGPTLAKQPLEAEEVKMLGLDAEQVAGRLRDDDLMVAAASLR